VTVTAPTGFRAAGVAAGLKPDGARDVALVVNDGPAATAAGLFTTNRFAAAPVRWSRAVLDGGRVRAVLLNSGGANACTGPPGDADAAATAHATADALGVRAGEVAVCSTGLIGTRLPMGRLLAGVAAAAGRASGCGGADAADAIRTTDRVPKQAVGRGRGFTVGGMAKGAGMIAPELATMLVVLTTDAAADRQTLAASLGDACADTFGVLDTDGCSSTNDTVLLLASGAAGPADRDRLSAALGPLCADLAEQLLADAEGATKAIRVRVSGAATRDDALAVGRAVARSNLVKCALHGSDPNWGRILAAVGTTSAAFDPSVVDISLDAVTVARGGALVEGAPAVDLTGPQVEVGVELHAGDAEVTLRTTDLSAAYVAENSAYST
jgi:glutamate N-acetyltransferase/amino-acid N-acetyltransferase